MIPVGYMYKTDVSRPDGLKAPSVDDIYSVSNCISPDFADWINAWKHNGYWFFDDPQIIEELARAECIVLDEMTLFFYRMYEQEWDPEDKEWRRISPGSSFRTEVVIPKKLLLETLDQAIEHLKINSFIEGEPGPYRISVFRSGRVRGLVFAATPEEHKENLASYRDLWRLMRV